MLTSERPVYETDVCETDGQQEAQGLDASLDKMEDNDHIKLDNIEI